MTLLIAATCGAIATLAAIGLAYWAVVIGVGRRCCGGCDD